MPRFLAALLDGPAHDHAAAVPPVDAFLPHGYCYQWNRPLLVTHVTSDLLIGLSYVVIAFTLAALVHRVRREIPFSALFVAFGLFIVACGMTHFVEIWTLWRPAYWLAGGVKVVTALASVATAAAMPTLLPKVRATLDAARLSRARELELARASALSERNSLLQGQASTLERQNDQLQQQALALELQTAEAHALAAELAGTLERLRASEARLAAVIGSAMDAIITVDSSQRVLVFNAAAERTFGVPAAEAIGGPLNRFLPARARAAHHGHVRAFGETGATHRSMGRPGELVGLRVDGTEFPIEATISTVEDGGDRLYTVVLRDTTERRQLEAQLRQAQRMEAVGQLAGGVAHDFNNLLTIIQSYAGFLRDELPVNDPRRQDADEVLAAADRATGVTRQLLAFSRAQVVAPRVLDLNGVVRGVETMLRRLVGEEIELSTVLDPHPAHVRGDGGQLEQVVLNLVVNARDAMPGGGLLTIETARVTLTAADVARYAAGAAAVAEEAPGEYAVLRVVDSGMGMDAATQARIFEPFFTTKEVGRGTGLGLATVYGIVRQAGGSVRVRSAPHQGACFEILLPLVQADADAAAAPAAERAPGGTGTVLVVEDEVAVRRSVMRILSQAGYTVVDARHGADALLVWQERQGAVDLVLTDLRMPELGGRELVAWLRAERPELPVLLMSGYAAGDASGGPADDLPVLEKPFSSDSLLRAVRAAVERKS